MKIVSLKRKVESGKLYELDKCFIRSQILVKQELKKSEFSQSFSFFIERSYSDLIKQKTDYQTITQRYIQIK